MSKYTLPAAAAAALRFEETVLPNGLIVRLLPMPEYGAVHVIYAAGFGSVHRAFSQNGTRIELPAGTAHFLEHKMFENEDGTDAFSLFGETGASANAYTGFDRTSYVFTSTGQIERNLDILLSFVSHPHFTAATVKKEQGIIGQEIGMYQDIPEMRSMFGMLECLYGRHPVRDDIAGTAASIAGITPKLLYSCTDAFYTPANMALCAAGNLTMSQLLNAVERSGLSPLRACVPAYIYPSEPPEVTTARCQIAMPVSIPMFSLGFKETPPVGDTLRTEVICELLGELLCGEASPLYRRLYDEGLVQPSFGCDYGCHDGCLYFSFSGESRRPNEVCEAIIGEIERQRTQGIDPEQFDICKRMMYGDAIADLENVERVAAMLCSTAFRRRSPAEEVAAITGITACEVRQALDEMLCTQRSAVHIVSPQEE